MMPTEYKNKMLHTPIQLIIDNKLYGPDNRGFGDFAHAEVIYEKEKTYIKARTEWYGCRGYMCEALAELKLEKYQCKRINEAPKYGWKNTALINFTKRQDVFYLLVRNLTQEQMFQAVKLLNYLEGTSGWNKSNYIELTPTLIGATQSPNTYLLITDKKWIKAMPYFSLLMLLVRINKRRLFEPTHTMSIYTENVVKDRLARLDNLHYTDRATLFTMYRRYKNTIQVLMKNIDYITEQVVEDPTTITDIQYFHNVGIFSIVQMLSQNYTLKIIKTQLEKGVTYFHDPDSAVNDMYISMIYRLHEKMKEQGEKRHVSLPDITHI